MDQPRIVGARQTLGIAGHDGSVALGPQGVIDQGEQSRIALRGIQPCADLPHHIRRPGQHGWRQHRAGRQGRQGLGPHQRPHSGPGDGVAHLSWRHRKLQHQIKPPDQRGVHLPHGVRHPEGGHRVGLQRPVQPALAVLARVGTVQSEQARDVALGLAGEHILDLVEQDQRPTPRQEALRRPPGPQPLLPADRIAVLVRRAHLQQLTIQDRGQRAAQFGLARARRAVEQDIGATLAASRRVVTQGRRQIGAQQRPAQPQMRVIVQGEARRSTGGDCPTQQRQRLGVRRQHGLGKGGREQFQPGGQRALARPPQTQQSTVGQHPRRRQRPLHRDLGQVQQRRQHPDGLRRGQRSQGVGGVLEQPQRLQQTGTAQQPAVHGRELHQGRQACQVLLQRDRQRERVGLCLQRLPVGFEHAADRDQAGGVRAALPQSVGHAQRGKQTGHALAVMQELAQPSQRQQDAQQPQAHQGDWRLGHRRARGGVVQGVEQALMAWHGSAWHWRGMDVMDERLESARGVRGRLNGRGGFGFGCFGRIQAQAQGQAHMVVVAGGQPHRQPQRRAQQPGQGATAVRRLVGQDPAHAPSQSPGQTRQQRHRRPGPAPGAPPVPQDLASQGFGPQSLQGGGQGQGLQIMAAGTEHRLAPGIASAEVQDAAAIQPDQGERQQQECPAHPGCMGEQGRTAQGRSQDQPGGEQGGDAQGGGKTQAGHATGPPGRLATACKAALQLQADAMTSRGVGPAQHEQDVAQGGQAAAQPRWG